LRSESSGVFEGPSSSLLGSGSAKTPPAQALGVPASASSFRVVREFRGENSEGSKQVPCSATEIAPRARRFVVGLAARSLTDGGKGIDQFFARLPVDRAFVKETTFVLIGDGRIRVPAGVDCRFLGHIDSPGRLAEIYRSLDLFVSASAMETFGMAILEAQACGTPVVAFETGGTPEAVCSSVSRLVPNGNFPEIFRVVEEMFDTARSEGGKNQKLAEWVSERHGWQAIAVKQMNAYL
jgi:glycosyltransferase involved in cell wall biosynthesis